VLPPELLPPPAPELPLPPPPPELLPEPPPPLLDDDELGLLLDDDELPLDELELLPLELLLPSLPKLPLPEPDGLDGLLVVVVVD
jgi:hypothetical protein